ncbi:MAG: YicC family protein, partial [Gammaproteobacteria bacterium]
MTQYLRTLEALQTDFRLPGTIDLSTLLQFRDILQVEESPPDFEAVWAFLSPPLDEALAALARMREREGSSLETDIAQRLAIIGQHSQQIAERVPLMADAYRERLQQRITELLEEGEVDPNRLAQEVVFFAERSDISEELTRLHSHIQEFRHIMTQPEPVGRKLDFLAQEMHREINTIGAKANDSTIAQVVVHMKSELE